MASTGSLRLARTALDVLRVLRRLGGGPAVDADRQRLAMWPGWGPLAPAFDSQPEGKWLEIADELDDLFSEDPAALEAAANCVDNSFYTPQLVVDHMWAHLEHVGFRGGRILEPGCGSGRFLAAAPSGMAVEFTGVESDPTSAAIAAALHPTATIHATKLQDIAFRDGAFDAVLANVPFSSANISDPAHDFYGSLHSYFLRRAVRAVRPGGYVLAVTSRYVMDAAEPDELVTLGRHASLRAAVRLPAGTFSADGTDVVADVLMLQVHDPDVRRGGWDNSVNRGESTSGWDRRYRSGADNRAVVAVDQHGAPTANTVRVNQYWEQFPKHVAGRMAATGFTQSPLTVRAADRGSAIADAFAATRPQLEPIPARASAAEIFADVVLEDDHGRKEGSFHLIGGVVHKVSGGQLVAVPRAGKELQALIVLRDAVADLFAAESNWDTPDEELTPLREQARGLYDQYVAKFGPLNRGTLHEGKPDPDTGMPRWSWRTPPLGGFRSDPDSSMVFAIEMYDQDSGDAEPAQMLVRRVNKRPTPITHADTAGEALAVTLGEGGLDLDRVAGLLSLPDADAAFAELGDLVYRDPTTGNPVTARDYQAGNVRVKLEQARAAATRDGQYQRNVDLLEDIQPVPLTRHDIRCELGAPWLTEADITAFITEEFGVRARVTHTPIVATWEITGHGTVSAAAAVLYGTPKMAALELLAHGLNGRTPKVYDDAWDKQTGAKRRIVDAAATAAATDKLASIAERFRVWVWEDAAREARIVDDYNRRFNSHLLRRDDGSHLTFPTLADHVNLWPWQRDFIDRALATPRSFCAHAVGLGKTLTMLGLAVTLRRFGLANKPMIVVPNHLIEQVSRTARQAMPTGKFLIVSRADLTGAARRLFAARCSTGDWDAVVLTHEAFTSIPVSGDDEKAYHAAEIAELRNQMHAAGGTSKHIARAMRTLEGRIGKARENVADPNAIEFDQLGVDFLAVDEADAFRRLLIATRAEGFSLGSSKRATDMLMKVHALGLRNPDRPHVAFFTGTPFTNTLAEAYVWMKFMIPHRLTETGTEHFDAWAAAFVRYVTEPEVAPDGSGFRIRTRPSLIKNVPELRTMLGEFMSILPADHTDLERPDVDHHTVVCEPGEETVDYIAGLVERAEQLQRGQGPDGDNMLWICTDGRKCATDPALVGLDESPAKVAKVADNVARVYWEAQGAAATQPGMFQLVICDLGTPGEDGSQTYGRLRGAMIERGVPAELIRFVHEATTPKARDAMFAACRDGRVAVLIGSTKKVGIGTNIQDRLGNTHFVTVPWTPAAYEQALGRSVRTGNRHRRVGVYQYVTEGSFDAFMASAVHRKAGCISQLYTADLNAREIEDVGETVLTFTQIKAVAAGNPLLLRQAALTADAARLRRSAITFRQNIALARQNAAKAEDWASVLERNITNAVDAVAGAAHLPLSADLARVGDFSRRLVRDRGTRRPDGGVTVSSLGLRVMSSGVQRGRGYPDSAVVLELRHDYHVMAEVVVPAKVLRRGSDATAEFLLTSVREWFEGARAMIAATEARLKQLRADAAEAHRAVETMTFDGADELAAVEAELAAVTAEIEREAADPRELAAA